MSIRGIISMISLLLQEKPTDEKILKLFKGVVSHSFPINEAWVFIILLIFFILLVFLVYSSDGNFIRNLRNFVSEKAKSTSIFSVDKLKHRNFSIVLNSFSIGVFSLFIYLLFYSFDKEFNFIDYFFFIITTIGFFLFKIISFKMLGFVFFQKVVTEHIITVYLNLLYVFSIIMYPIIVAYVYLPVFNREVLIVISLLLFLLFVIFLIIKLFQYLFIKTIALFYIILYLCTLEIIPFLVWFRLYSMFL